MTHRDRKLLYDGPYQNFDAQRYVIYNDEKFAFSAAGLDKSLGELATEISKSSFGSLLDFFGFSQQTFNDKTFYRSVDDLDIYYFIAGQTIFLISAGEFQSGRYVIYCEGIWENK